MKEKYPSACCSPLKHVNRKMRRRKEGASRGSRSKGETLRQPSWGDGTRTAQSVSLTTLPDTGWLTQNHTLFSKYQETVQLRTHTNTHRQILVEHAVLRQTAWYIAMQTLILGENTCASFFFTTVLWLFTFSPQHRCAKILFFPCHTFLKENLKFWGH